MERCVEPELLDELTPADPRAVRSRDDLVRVNAAMGNGGIMARALRLACDGRAVRRCEADVRDWLARPAAEAYDVLSANLFLHHFQEAHLTGLLRAAAGSARVFIAVEPRRSTGSLFISRLLWFIGCGQVTRHDAVASVRAGFTGRELSGLWPADESWTLQERTAGLFSHLFIAQRRE